MSHLVPAAAELIAQVRVLRPDATWLILDEPDGYHRLRSVEFDTATSAWLRPILDAIRDPRIAKVSDDERMCVTFVGDVRADRRDPYPLVPVARVLYET